MGKSIQVRQAKETRVFAHDGLNLVTGSSLNADAANIPGTANEFGRGACVYVGKAMDEVTVTMESGKSLQFKGIAAGSFMPILVTAVTSATPSSGSLADNDILALY